MESTRRSGALAARTRSTWPEDGSPPRACDTTTIPGSATSGAREPRSPGARGAGSFGHRAEPVFERRRLESSSIRFPATPISSRSVRPPTTSARNTKWPAGERRRRCRSEEHTSELQSRVDLVCRLLLEKKKKKKYKKLYKYSKKDKKQK